ncbi:MAG: ABC transporter substrate-binding protein [Paludibacteraceae bacterium]|nr:ABC transporter substrate-binding protein [Paludibacteraceae bacterium]
MKKNTAFLILVSFILLLAGCHRNKISETHEGKEIRFDYAKLIRVWECDGFKKMEIRNPWDTTCLLQTYLLVDKTKEIPANCPGGVVVRVPLEKSAVFTTVHCSLIEELGAVGSISGICELEYITNPNIISLTQSGKIVDFGSSMSPDIEKIITVSPDAILLSPFNNSGGHGGLDKLGIPIVECADYMESDPLGRAEWIKLYGMLFGKESEADSIFSKVTETYTQIEKEAQQETGSHPSLLYGLDNGGSWFIPGGKSYMAKMFASAGANYIFGETTHSGAEPFAFETVYDKGCNADIWLILGTEVADKTYKDLQRFSNFKSYKEKRVYACNTTKTSFFDEIPFHPERLLKDLYVIFHSEKYGDVNEYLHYYRKLAE